MASKPNDPFLMPALIGGLVLLGAVVFVLVSNLFNTIEKNSVKGDMENNALYTAQADANIAPVGHVVAVDKSVAPKARNGEEVYKSVCLSCHATGTLGAPKIDDKAAWSARAGNGLAGLLKTAIDGKGNMPARGGDPSITDDELKSAILFMTEKAGLTLDDAGSDASTGDATPATDAAQAAPAAPVAPSAAQAPAAPETPAAPATPTTPETPTTEATAPAAAPSEEAAPAAAAAAPSHAGINGEKVYKGLCFSCHDVGVANAPKLGDVAAWTDRIAAGNESMYNIAINGKGAMPAKGGNPALSDDEIKAAVDYMAAQSQ